MLLGVAAVAAMPLPFTRELREGDSGTDVQMMRQLLSWNRTAVQGDAFDAAAASGLRAFQADVGSARTGVLDEGSARTLLDTHGWDGFVDRGRPARETGHRFKLANRSIEQTARLLDADNALLLRFRVRLHGASRLPPPAWPHWDSSGAGLNQFTSDGATPTGLMEVDLNSPESDPESFGPYPVLRVVRGLEGNAAFLLRNAAVTPRSGILVHTGDWIKHGWPGPPAPMPNSLGCIHAWPESIDAVWQLLVNSTGTKVRPNSDGARPYVPRPQGLLVVQRVSPSPPAWPATAVVPRTYPLYKQCDGRWGANVINSKTICAVGCLMSSISMMLAGHQIAVPGSGGANPGTLNAWLRANKGYDGRDDLEEDAIPRLAPGRVQWGGHGMHRANDVSREAALQLLRAGQPVIANVLAGHHFVLVVGVDAHDPDILYVNDPGFSTTTYSHKTVVGWRLFNVTG